MSIAHEEISLVLDDAYVFGWAWDGGPPVAFSNFGTLPRERHLDLKGEMTLRLDPTSKSAFDLWREAWRMHNDHTQAPPEHWAFYRWPRMRQHFAVRKCRLVSAPPTLVPGQPAVFRFAYEEGGTVTDADDDASLRADVLGADDRPFSPGVKFHRPAARREETPREA